MDGRAILKTFFLTGEKPTQDQFADLIDSCLNLVDDTITISMVSGLSSALAGKASAFSGSSNEYTKGDGTYAVLGETDITTALGFTPENVANKSTSTSLGTSNSLYPSQNAVKAYVDAAIAGVSAGSVAWSTLTGTPTTLAGYGITDALSAATAAATYLPLAGGTLSGDVQQPTSPVNSSSLVTKGYVDNALAGIDWKAEVACATTANITLSGEQTIDGVTTSASRVLVWQQTNQTQNGIYVSGTGVWARATDVSTGAEIETATVLVKGGSTYGNTQFTCSNTSVPTIGTTNITFAQIAAAGVYTNGTGLSLSGNVFSINTAYTASATQTGYLASSDWSAFNSKQSAVTTGATTQYFRGDLSLATFPTNLSSFANGPGYLTTATAATTFAPLASPAFTGTPGFTLGSDATGDIWYRNSAGNMARLGIGSTGQLLTVSGGLPSWATFSDPLLGYTTTATAGGNTTLTAASTYQQFFTGSLNQTVIMPAAGTMTLGGGFKIVNSGTGSVAVVSSGSNAIVTLAANNSAVITCILASGTTAASWFASSQVNGSSLTSAETITYNGVQLTLSDGTHTPVTFQAWRGGLIIGGTGVNITGASGLGVTYGFAAWGNLFNVSGSGIFSQPQWTTQTSGIFFGHAINMTITNFSGTAAYNGLQMNITEATAFTGTGSRFLMLLQRTVSSVTTTYFSIDYLGNVAASSVRGSAVTFANLPASPVKGMLVEVTDSTVNTWGATISGGGSYTVNAHYNGSTWTVSAI